MSNKQTIEWGVATNPSYIEDMQQLALRMYRDEYIQFLKANPDIDSGFRAIKETIMAKMNKEQFYATIMSCMEEVLKKHLNWTPENPPLIRKLDYDAHNTEICHQPDTDYVDLDRGGFTKPLTPSMVKIFVSFRDYQLRAATDYDDGAELKFEISTVIYEMAGHEGIINDLAPMMKAAILKSKDTHKTAMVKWVFDGGSRAGEQTFQVHKDWTVDKDFYPWMKSDLLEYYQAYKDSTAKILIVYGPAGTGKTSFIRDMLCELGMNAIISFDQKMLMSDMMFVNYMMDTIHDCIVMEDSDDLLTGGRSESNKIISKILNVSDGIIKMPSKKMIFSTNLPKIGDIDSAIIRPSRCFDLLEFRLLTFDEAQVVAKKYNIVLPQKAKYTLAEIFAEKEMQECPNNVVMDYNKRIQRKMGFN